MSYTGVGFIGWGSGSDYPDIKSGGKYISWWGEDWDDDEVYILRFQVSGLPSTPTSSSQVYPLLRAYVQSIPSGLRNQDVRGITVLPSGQTEIVFTDAGGIHYGKMDAGDMQRDMNAALSNMGSSLSVSKTSFAYINNDLKDKLSFWFQQPALWKYASYNAAGKGNISQGFTKAYMDQQGIWLNSSAVQTQYMLKPPPPVILDAPPSVAAKPPVKPASPPPGANQPEVVEQGMSTTTVVAIGLAGAAALYFLTQKKGRRA
jgi:hypothetical protein